MSTKSGLHNGPVNETQCREVMTFCSRRNDLSVQNIKIANDSELKYALSFFPAPSACLKARVRLQTVACHNLMDDFRATDLSPRLTLRWFY